MIPASFMLEGKVALIVGDRQGWLGEMASYFIEAGASIAVVDDDSERLEQIALTMKDQEQRIICILSNLTDSQEIENTVCRVNSQFGKIDILVNNMGHQITKPTLDMTEEDWNSVISGNLTAVFLWTKAIGKYMLAKKQGSIININSILSERGVVNSAAFCAANGGIEMFTKALALEWASRNVRVNTIGVGWVERDGDETDEAEARLQRYISLGSFCRPDDIAALLIYFASPASSYVTGQTYFVSGGVMSHG